MDKIGQFGRIGHTPSAIAQNWPIGKQNRVNLKNIQKSKRQESRQIIFKSEIIKLI